MDRKIIVFPLAGLSWTEMSRVTEDKVAMVVIFNHSTRLKLGAVRRNTIRVTHRVSNKVFTFMGL